MLLEGNDRHLKEKAQKEWQASMTAGVDRVALADAQAQIATTGRLTRCSNSLVQTDRVSISSPKRRGSSRVGVFNNKIPPPPDMEGKIASFCQTKHLLLGCYLRTPVIVLPLHGRDFNAITTATCTCA